MLRIDGLTAGYGAIPVLHGIDIAVEDGECVTLIGSNGAGKSTLLKVVAGLLPATRGRVEFDGADVTALPAHSKVTSGLALVPEGRMLFGSMSVDENLELGAYSVKGPEARKERDEALERVRTLFPVLAERGGQQASTLSGGEQQMLAVGRALMSRPKMLLLDEPSLGLAPKVIREIFSALEALREQGLTILLVEQDAKLALKHADRGYVMRTGTVALSGSASELIANDDVRLIYLGAWHGDGRES